MKVKKWARRLQKTLQWAVSATRMLTCTLCEPKIPNNNEQSFSPYITGDHEKVAHERSMPETHDSSGWKSDNGSTLVPESDDDDGIFNKNSPLVDQNLSSLPPLASIAVANPATKSADLTRQPSSQGHKDGSQLMLQPETRPISQDQLVAEVKGIYAGLAMVETKCIEVDSAQSSNSDANKLNNEQWQALIALHRTLLHEHYDFFLASQHPSASLPLRQLASKYAMPARMWRHGIHTFLELLRLRLPASLEHMLTFLYLAYSMMALLYETVPAFEETWIECLGDLARYRMAIEDNIKDREVWTGVSQHWYSKASDTSPTTGRLYHHLAILARPNAVQQLYYYAKSLCVPIPFLSAREGVMTLFDPIFDSDPPHLSETDTYFVRAHGILFSGKGGKENLDEAIDAFLDRLDGSIAGATKTWLEAGYFMGIAAGCSLLEYGAESNVLMRAISQRPDETDVTMDGSSIVEGPPSQSFTQALEFAVAAYEIVVRRRSDTNTLPFIHTILVFIFKMTQYPAAISYLEKSFPWALTTVMLNDLLDSCEFEPRMNGDFPGPEKDESPRPLPEDYAMRGLIYAMDYHPEKWFVDGTIHEEEKYFELASMAGQRMARILYLGYKIATQSEKWLTFDTDAERFSVTAEYDVKPKVKRTSSLVWPNQTH